MPQRAHRTYVNAQKRISNHNLYTRPSCISYDVITILPEGRHSVDPLSAVKARHLVQQLDHLDLVANFACDRVQNIQCTRDISLVDAPYGRRCSLSRIIVAVLRAWSTMQVNHDSDAIVLSPGESAEEIGPSTGIVGGDRLVCRD